MSRILFSWIGGADWGSLEDGAEPGPILRTLTDDKWKDQFDEVHLLNNYDKKGSSFKKALRKKTKIKIVCRDVKLTSPTNFGEVDEATRELIRSVPSDSQLIFLCSPGTWVMSSVLVLIAHNEFERSTLLEASKEAGVVEIEMPFQIAVRDVIDRADNALNKISQGRRPYAREFESIKHDCGPMRLAIKRASLVVQRQLSILIEGEPGTGRQMLAQCIHNENSHPKTGRADFLAINCSAHPDDQLEVKFFGSVQAQSQQGEVRHTRGLLQKSSSSTLYVSEIDTLVPYLQARLVETIAQNKDENYKKRPRLIFSSTRPLNEAVIEGSFRRDLFYAITQDVIFLPALRDRGVTDLELITDDLLLRLKNDLFLEKRDMGKLKLDRSARKLLEVSPFEGNVRELESILVRALVYSEGVTITKSDMEAALGVNRSSSSGDDVLNRALDEDFILDEVLDEVTRHYLARAKTSTKSLRQAAKALGFKNYQTLANRIKKLEGFDW